MMPLGLLRPTTLIHWWYSLRTHCILAVELQVSGPTYILRSLHFLIVLLWDLLSSKGNTRGLPPSHQDGDCESRL